MVEPLDADLRFSNPLELRQFGLANADGQICEAEQNQITLAAVKSMGAASLNCCIQMYYSLALITKGCVRTFVRSVAECHGAEVWRLIHSRYVPKTQNRQYALMQIIMLSPKRWCDHAEGFESDLCFIELAVGEWERASGIVLADAVKYTVMMNIDSARFTGICCVDGD